MLSSFVRNLLKVDGTDIVNLLSKVTFRVSFFVFALENDIACTVNTYKLIIKTVENS